ncbi:MAG: SDR family NAD(P)-dependent oxidoreductase [Spirochaetia bacterium]
MNPAAFTEISPLIRGMSAKNMNPCMVRYLKNRELYRSLNDSDSAVLVLDPKGGNLEEQLLRAVETFGSESGGFPRAILTGSEDVYITGRDWDDIAGVLSGGEKDPLQPAQDRRERDRNRLVENRICLVTGAAQGFGEGIARSLAEGGAFVALADLNVEGAAKVADDINSRQGRVTSRAYAMNVTDEESVREAVTSLTEEAGGIDLLISNAGVLKAGSVKELAYKDFQFVTGVNYAGFFLCAKHFAPVMARQNRGLLAAAGYPYYTDIVQINSKSGLEGSNKNGAYAGSKFGGIGLVQSFALELVEDNIKVNAVCPGNFFDGPLWSDPEKGLFRQYLDAGKVEGAETVADVKAYYEAKVPMNRGCSVEDVMTAVLYLVDQKYETGQALPVTGGQVMLR